ncbi:putative fibronectin/fibrinogen binding protein [Candidatus Protochlamydia naegleriophila]|uniref:Putative fibronectin/fibrinogen binding protein n=1 Tax=Candidatus Protochlamydia naegleriophila TaxID=389348 RepID=A0A0U5EUG6_9BACT|nr:NFACT RNA binding domain-containing protein [Candidatus Protochlamydia naegleriophila]CUI17825.1 putative fibronectin/fibrinogen binding protein [Candidatus Protochlamydia naegleriophila]
MNTKNFSAAQLKTLLPEFEKHLKGSTYLSCNGADPRRFVLFFEKNGKKEALFLCMEGPIPRCHLTENRTFHSSSSSHPLHSILKGATLLAIEQINADRILKMHFQSPHHMFSLICEFFTRHPNYYITDRTGQILFSLFPLPHSHYQPPSKNPSSLSNSSAFTSSKEVEKIYDQLEGEWILQKEKKEIQALFQREWKRMQKKLKELEKELAECSQWEQVKHEGELLKSQFSSLKKGMREINVWDWLQNNPRTLQLSGTLTPQEELAHRFKKAKKLHGALSHLPAQIERINQKIKELEDRIRELESAETIEALKSFKPQLKPILSVKEKIEKRQLPYHEYRSSTGLLMWVGKNAKANDSMTFTLANGSDWWLHAQGIPGSHIVIRTLKGRDPDPETIADALQLALYFSKAKEQQEADICITQRKYVSRLGKNQPGKVQISKHKTVWIRFDPQRFQAIKQRQAEKKDSFG